MTIRTSLVAAAALSWLLAACGEEGGNAAPPAPPPSVGVIGVARKPITEAAAFVGRVEAIDKVDLRARVTGFLEKRHFTEGQDVAVDDLLFTLERAPYEAEVEQRQAELARAEANAQNAELQLRRARELLRNQNIPQATVDERVAASASAQADILQAKAALRQAQINLGYTEIRSPIVGRIGRAAFSEGNLVGPDSGILATIVHQDPMYVTFPVSQREVLEFQRRVAEREADPAHVVVRLRLSDGSLYPQPGRINFLDVQVSPGTDTVTVRAEVPNPKRTLVEGQFASVTVESETPEPALVVPQAAVQTDQAGSFVLVVDSEKKVEVRRVTLGASQEGDVVVAKGLKEGEQIVLEGIQKVRPGQVVSPAPASAAPGA